ncbi:MAG: acylphosphatase [Kordiimonas sp.]|nr:acylphosphatase [Kordiimonas sp.]
MLAEGKKAVKAVISGKVQGVWFRDWTVQEAQKRHLDGWVRNRTEGTVEAMFVGDEADVDDMLHACESGPAAARVDRVDVRAAIGIVAKGFVRKPTVDLGESRNQ